MLKKMASWQSFSFEFFIFISVLGNAVPPRVNLKKWNAVPPRVNLKKWNAVPLVEIVRARRFPCSPSKTLLHLISTLNTCL